MGGNNNDNQDNTPDPTIQPQLPLQPQSVLPNSAKPAKAKLIYGLVAFLGGFFALLMLWKLKDLDFQVVANADFARGLITLTIILAFVILGVILILSALYGSLGDSTESDARFRRAREVYTSVVGIVGTIVGFYFGAVSTTEPLQVIKKVEGKNVIVKITGGNRPYNMTVTSKADKKVLISDDGLLTFDACTLADPTGDDNKLEVRDAKQNTKQLDLGKILADKALCTTVNKEQKEAQPEKK